MKKFKAMIMTAGLTLMATTAGVLGGCSSCNKMPAAEAFACMRNNVSMADRLKVLTGPGRAGDLASQEAASKEAELKEIESRLQDATVPSTAITAMADELAAYLLEELPADADSRGLAGQRLYLAMGDLINTDTTDQKSVLDGVLDQVRTSLVNNSMFTNRFDIVAVKRDRADEIIEIIKGDGATGINNPANLLGGAPVKHVPNSNIYAVEGKIYTSRGGSYSEQFTLHVILRALRPNDNQEVAAKSFQKTYHYHPARRAFISDEENNRLMFGS